MTLVPFPDQQILAEEIHSRPQPELETPAAVSHLVVLADDAATDRSREALAALCRRYGAPPPHNERYYAVKLGLFSARWEQHTEFFRLTFSRPLEPGTRPFSVGALDLVPSDWVQSLDGELIAAADIVVLERGRQLTLPEIDEAFEGHRVVASRVMGGVSVVYTDFRLHAGEAARYLVTDLDLTPPRAGRLLQRLTDIEAYRMTALLGLPVARAHSPRLRHIEDSLADLVAKIGGPRDLTADRNVLDGLFSRAAEVERMVAESSYRFGATQAYGQLVADRLGELRGEREGTFQPLEEFLERRFEPALRTCQSVAQRQEAVGERIARTASLARTRVDLELERQNQELLASMDKRAQLQLRLQETVEGLSVAAISYYTVGLLSYFVKGAKGLGIEESTANLVLALVTPIVVLLVWRGVQAMRRRVHSGVH
ncbi:MAG: DUF3422 domain-containing protein [Geminicoccaceae bacterium]